MVEWGEFGNPHLPGARAAQAGLVCTLEAAPDFAAERGRLGSTSRRPRRLEFRGRIETQAVFGEGAPHDTRGRVCSPREVHDLGEVHLEDRRQNSEIRNGPDRLAEKERTASRKFRSDGRRDIGQVPSHSTDHSKRHDAGPAKASPGRGSGHWLNRPAARLCAPSGAGPARAGWYRLWRSRYPRRIVRQRLAAIGARARRRISRGLR